MVSFKKYFLIIFIIFILVIPLKALLGPQFYTSHDGQSHLARLYQLDKVIRDGQLPPRWAGQFAGERGYPVFIFAYPLPYWLAEVFYLSGFNLAESIKLVFALFYILSGLAMYWLVKELFKNQWAGFLAAVLYTWAPYRFVKIFVTASLGESMAFTFIPLILLAIYKFSLLGFALSLTALILTHLISLIMFLPLMGSFIFWILRVLKRDKKIRMAKRLWLGILLGLGLSAFYLLPAVWEKRYTRYAEVLAQNYFQQFVEPLKLLYSKWGYGVPKITPDGLSLQLGAAQWLVILSTLTLVFLTFKKLKKQKKFFYLSLLVLFNFWLSVFLMLAISKPLWDLLPPLQTVDTPWRFLGVLVFTSAFLGGWFIRELKSKTLMIFMFLFLLFLAFYGNRHHLRINAPINYDEKYFAHYYWVGSGWDEYRPKWLKDTYHKPPKKLVEIINGSCKVSQETKKSNFIAFNLFCEGPAEVLVNGAYYPGWRLWVGEKEFTSQMIANLEESSGLILFKVQKGNHQIKLKFGETLLRLTADGISLFSLLVLIFLFLKRQVDSYKANLGASRRNYFL